MQIRRDNQMTFINYDLNKLVTLRGKKCKYGGIIK